MCVCVYGVAYMSNKILVSGPLSRLGILPQTEQPWGVMSGHRTYVGAV